MSYREREKLLAFSLLRGQKKKEKALTQLNKLKSDLGHHPKKVTAAAAEASLVYEIPYTS